MTEALAQTERNLRALYRFSDSAHGGDHPPIRLRKRCPGVGCASPRRIAGRRIPELRLAKVGNEWVWAVGARDERNLCSAVRETASLPSRL